MAQLDDSTHIIYKWNTSKWSDDRLKNFEGEVALTFMQVLFFDSDSQNNLELQAHNRHSSKLTSVQNRL